jgi:glycosyltransferase involved in cell wall biosynthesis
MSISAKKILLMGHVDGLGGAQTAYRELYKFIDEAGYDTRIINITDRKFKEQPFGSDKILKTIAHKGDGATFTIKKWGSLVDAGLQARLFNPDIFITVGLSNSSSLVAGFLNKSCFKLAQDFIANRNPDEPIWIKSRKNFDGIALQAPSMLEYWKRREARLTGVSWLPCFPDPPVNNILKTGGYEAGGAVRLSYFGRLAGNKGLPLLFKALASLKKEYDVTLDLWGKGEEEATLKTLAAELNIESRVRFLGRYPADEEGARLMASYDGMVLTSTEMEGLPLILLEAMAYGLPFLATNIGAIRDCCTNNADTVLVEPTETEILKGLTEFVKKIQSNDFNPLRLRSFYERTFSRNVMIDHWQGFINSPQNFFYEN